MPILDPCQEIICIGFAQKVIWLSGCGFAAGCEAGFRPAVSFIHFDLGYALGSG
jgi:hypothetical protein